MELISKEQGNVNYRWVILGLLFSIQAAGSMAVFAFGPLAPVLQEILGVTRAQVGMFSSVIYLGMMVFGTHAGWLTDRYGIRLFLLVGSGALGLLFSMIALSRSFPLTLLIVFIAGIGYQFINPATLKGLALWFPPKLRATVIGIKQGGVSFGGAVASAILPFLVSYIGWQGSIVFIGVVIFIITLIVAFFYREPEVKLFSSDEKLRAESQGILRLLRNRDLILLGVSGAMYGISANSFCAYLVLYLKESFSMSIIMAGSLLAVSQVGTMFGRILWGTLSDWYFGGNRKVPFSIIGFLIAIMCGMTKWILPLSSYWANFIFFAIFGFSLGFNGLYLTFAAEVGQEMMGTSVGYATAIWALGVVIGVPIFGYIADKTSSYDLSWVYLTILALIGAGLALFTRERK